MTKVRALAVFPFAFTAVFVLVSILTGGNIAVVRATNETVKVLAVIGCLAAALAFDRGDYLRRAWLLNGLCVFLLLTRDVTIIPAIENALHNPRLVRGILVIIANTSSVIGLGMLARAWRLSTQPTTTSALRIASIVAAAGTFAARPTNFVPEPIPRTMRSITSIFGVRSTPSRRRMPIPRWRFVLSLSSWSIPTTVPVPRWANC